MDEISGNEMVVSMVVWRVLLTVFQLAVHWVERMDYSTVERSARQ